jgi:threonine/homoserine/homoserine lactone efflux protein
LHALASALGLSTILAASITAFMMVKLAGGAYLVYLGLRMLLTKPAVLTSSVVSQELRPLQKIFWQAVITNVLNPKVILFFLSFIPQFVRTDSTQKTGAFLVLGLTMAAISLVWNSGTAMLAGTLAQRANANPHIKQWLERTVGAAFIALGAKLFFTKN